MGMKVDDGESHSSSLLQLSLSLCKSIHVMSLAWSKKEKEKKVGGEIEKGKMQEVDLTRPISNIDWLAIKNFLFYIFMNVNDPTETLSAINND